MPISNRPKRRSKKRNTKKLSDKFLRFASDAEIELSMRQFTPPVSIEEEKVQSEIAREAFHPTLPRDFYR